MDRNESPLIAIAVCLAALAGFVDALAFVSLGGFFVSFMSGSTTRLGTGLGSGTAWVALTGGALVLSFVGGVIVAAVLARARPARHQEATMIVVAALLTAAAGLATFQPGPLVLIFMAMAMGCQNGVLHRGGEVMIGTTYLTGTLVRMGQKLAGALMGDADRWGWVPGLTLWLGFLAGAVMGTAAQWRWGVPAIWIAPIAAVLLALVVGRVRKA